VNTLYVLVYKYDKPQYIRLVNEPGPLCPDGYLEYLIDDCETLWEEDTTGNVFRIQLINGIPTQIPLTEEECKEFTYIRLACRDVSGDLMLRNYAMSSRYYSDRSITI